MRSLRILVVTPSIPWPPNWGFGIRVYQLVAHLSQRHQVSVVCAAQPGEEDKAAELARVCHSVHTVPSPLTSEGAKRRAQLRSMVALDSFQSRSARTPEMIAMVDGLLAAEPFDIVQFESTQMSALTIRTGTKWILDEHNVEYELLHRMYQTERSPLRKFYNFCEYVKVRREEVRSWARADGCVVTSERERVMVAEREPRQRLHVSPNGVDTDYFAPSSEPVDPNSMVYSGLMSYRPNIDAVVFFVRDVLPLVLEKNPQAHFTIVGLDPSPEVKQLAGPSVTVTGGVPDVRPYTARAAAFVVPLRMGSGTRLKILEGLSMSKAIVSTAIGCEGISVVDGEHLLVADSATELADAILRVMHDAELAAALGRAGRELVEREYGWGLIARGLEEFYARVLDE